MIDLSSKDPLSISVVQVVIASRTQYYMKALERAKNPKAVAALDRRLHGYVDLRLKLLDIETGKKRMDERLDAVEKRMKKMIKSGGGRIQEVMSE